MKEPNSNDLPPIPRQADVLGVKVSAINLATAIELALSAIVDRAPHYICVSGVHGVIEAQNDSELMRIYNEAYLNVPDGMPMAWLGWWQGHHAMDRVFGPDLMSALCEKSIQTGYRHFFYGGRPGVARQLRDALQSRFPGLQVVGTYTPPFGPLAAAQEEELLALIRDAQPHILWVGISTPRQERFMANYIKRLPVPLMIGVGAAFDFHTGRIRDCAPWIKRAGLQWLHRLMQDPRRLCGRYLHCIPVFLWLIAWQLVGFQRHHHRRQGTIQEPHQKAEVRS